MNEFVDNIIEYNRLLSNLKTAREEFNNFISTSVYEFYLEQIENGDAFWVD